MLLSCLGWMLNVRVVVVGGGLPWCAASGAARSGKPPDPCSPPPRPRRLFGLNKAAQKLSVGFQQWAMNNDFKNDTQLLFASATLQQLHARIEAGERLDYLLTFGPPRLAGEGGPVDESEAEHPAARLGWRQYSLNCLAGGW